MEFPQAVTAFCTTVEELTDALDACKITDQPFSNLRSYLHSGSGSIAASSESIFSITSTSPGSSFRSEELVKSMTTATEFMQLKQLDPNDRSAVGTMNLRLRGSASIEGDPVSSLQVIEKHFNTILDLQNSAIRSITDSAGPLDDAGKLVLTCIRTAFFSNQENPLWLSKSVQNTFPNLVSLPAPPLDASRDFVRSTMEECCRTWVDTHNDLDTLIKRALECLENASDNAVEAAKGIQLKPSDKNLPKTMNDVIHRLEDAKNFISMTGKKRSDPLRVAVVGYMSHGKSSFINSLIGQHLLISEGKSCTAWPMVIKHLDKQFEPVLRIDPDHFKDYLQTLEKVGTAISGGLPGQNINVNVKLQHVRRTAVLTKRQNFNMLLFETGFKFKDEYRGQKEILMAQGMINDLIRLCATFSSYVQEPDESPQPKNHKWPELCVHMNEMAQLNEAFELVDLPGYGDKMAKQSNILEQNHRDVLKSVHGVILVATLLDNDMTSHSTSTMEYGRNELEPHQAPLLLAVGTKVDLQRDNNWSPESETEFIQGTFKSPASNRLTQTSPGLYIDALHAQKYLAALPDTSMPVADLEDAPNSCASTTTGSVTAGGVEPRASLSTLKKEDAITYTAFARANNWGTRYRTLEEDSSAYAKLTTPYLRELMQTIITRCDYQQVRNDIQEHVVRGGRNRYILKEMTTFIPYLDRVLEAEAAALRTSHGTKIIREAIERRYQESPDKMRSICNEWKLSKEKDLSTDTSEIVDSAMTLVTKQASAALETVIRNKYKEYATLPLKSQFKGVEQGIDFLVAVEKQLRVELDAIQHETVKTIRLHARDVWSTSIQGLRQRVNDTLIGDNKRSFNELGTALAADLKDLSAEAINGQVQQEIQDTIVEKLRIARPEAQRKAISVLQSTGMAAIRAAESSLFSAFRKRKGADQQSPPQNRATSTSPTGNIEAQKLINAVGVDSQNALGFLIRAPVLASAVDCPMTREIWPWITTSPGTPLFISSDQVKQQYTVMVLGPWENILKKECKVSLEGAIRLSIARGTKCVEEVIRRKTAELGVLRDSGETFSPDSLEQVDLLRVNSLSSWATTRFMCRNMHETLAESDELSRLTLPDIS